MAILALGISHRRAAVELLERLAFADEDLVKAYRRTADDAAVDEAVIVLDVQPRRDLRQGPVVSRGVPGR